MNTDLFQVDFFEKLTNRYNYDLFGSDLDENIHWGKLFFHLYGQCFSRYRIQMKVKNEKLIEYLILHYQIPANQIIRIDRASTNNYKEIDYERSEVLLILKDGFFLSLINSNIDLIYGPDITEADRNHLFIILDTFMINEPKIRQFHMIQYINGSFYLADFDIKPFEIDVSTHYNDDFQSIHNLIVSSLSTKDKNGLVLLHGKYGSGKTYYLRHLINKIEREFIYFPLQMVSNLNSPEFLPFLAEHKDAILILEDCEELLISRENGHANSSSLSTLLNLGDGLLSDALHINVICTFNANLKKIDDAILRKGRLLARYEFNELEPQKAKSLAQKIGKNLPIERPMTVSEIYNLENDSFENVQTKQIGFKAA